MYLKESKINFVHYKFFFSQGYITNAAYARSKLAQLMLTKYYNKKLSNTNVQVLAVHPGIVNTELFDGTLLKITMPWLLKYVCKVNYNFIFNNNVLYNFVIKCLSLDTRRRITKCYLRMYFSRIRRVWRLLC